MRTPIIAGNWKMNKTADEAVAFVEQIREGLNATSGVDIVLCPPALAIPAVAASVKGTKIGVGAQNMYYEANGAYTGEISPAMLQGLCRYVILGHSERRTDHKETDACVKAKATAAIAAGLVAVVCIGETEAERDQGKTLKVVSEQLLGSLPDGANAKTVVVAYEPVWAIGTGLTPTTPQIEEVHIAIRAALVEAFGDHGKSVAILYGGSVKPSNAAEILAAAEVGGALVGGASLKAQDFLGIINAI